MVLFHLDEFSGGSTKKAQKQQHDVGLNTQAFQCLFGSYFCCFCVLYKQYMKTNTVFINKIF